MTDFYCDISAVGNEYQAYADTPTTWAVPQDGNGLAGPGHSAAVAIGTIDCTSASASGAGVLGVLGVTVSSTLTGSGSTLATNIVTAINASATATGATYSALLLPLNKLVFARVNPGDANVVQIMLRIAGVDWNGKTHTTAGTWGTAPTMGAFSGGANGPFGYWVSDAALFGKAVGAYGLIAAKTAGVTAYSHTDLTHFRCARNGVPLTMTFNQTSMSIPITTNIHIVFDNTGIKWVGESGVVTINATYNTATGSPNFFYSASGYAIYLTAHVKNGLVINLYNVYAGNTTLTNVFVSYGGGFHFTNIKIEGKTATQLAFFQLGNFPASLFLLGCHLAARQNLYLINLQENIAMSAVDCTFEWVGAGQDIANAFSSLLASKSYYLSLINCQFIVDSGAFKVASVLSGGGNIYTIAQFRIENCTGITSSDIAFVSGVNRFSFYVYKSITGDFRFKTGQISIDRIIGSTYPSLTSVDPIGRTGTVQVSVDPVKTLGYVSQMLLDLRAVNRSGGTVKTLTVEVLCPSAVTLLKSHLVLRACYTDINGVVRNESSHGMDVLDAGVGLASWSLNGVSGVASKKVWLTTEFQVAANSEVTALLLAEGIFPAQASIYVNPELL